MFKNTNQLTEKQLNDLERLRAACKEADGSAPNLYAHILAKPRALPASLMYYENDKLVGFLSAFFFYDDSVEVALLIDPSFRKRGLAKKLLLSIIPLIQTHGLLHLIFSSPSHLHDEWLLAKGFSAMHSEYFMGRIDKNPILENIHAFPIRKATADDIVILGALDEACFPKKTNEFVERFQHLLDDRNYQIFIGFQNNIPIGKAHMRWDKQGATLSDIAVLPAHQGKGYGTTLIAHCINMALSEGKPEVCLDVETHNERALYLYTRLGFVVQNACDYWKISISDLLKGA